MAKGQFLPNIPDDIEDIEYETDVGGGPRTSADSLLDELMLELNDTSDKVSLSIYRQTGNGQESMQFVESMPPDKYGYTELLNYIRENYGAGDYRLQVRQNGKLKANKLVQIAKRVSQPQQNSGNDSALLHAIQGMQEQIAQQNQVIARMMQQPQGNSKKDFLEEMMIYKQLFSDNSPKHAGGVGELLQSVDALKSLGINVGLPSPEEKEEGFGDMIDKISPILMTAFQHQRQAPVRPNVKPNPQPRDEQMFEKMQLKMGIAQMVAGARNGADPSLFAEFVVNTVDQEKVDKYLTSPNAFQMVCQIDKNAAPYQAYFNDIKEHINGLYGRESKFSDIYSDFRDERIDDIKGETLDSESETTTNGDDV